MSVPPVTATSDAVKLDDDSLSLNVSTAVVPALSVCRLLLTAAVGSFVSMTNAGESTPARLALPAASVNFPAATDTVPDPVNPAVGVNVAV